MQRLCTTVTYFITFIIMSQNSHKEHFLCFCHTTESTHFVAQLSKTKLVTQRLKATFYALVPQLLYTTFCHTTVTKQFWSLEISSRRVLKIGQTTTFPLNTMQQAIEMRN